MTPPTSERSEPTSRPSDPDPVALSRVHLFGLDFVDADTIMIIRDGSVWLITSP